MDQKLNGDKLDPNRISEIASVQEDPALRQSNSYLLTLEFFVRTVQINLSLN